MVFHFCCPAVVQLATTRTSKSISPPTTLKCTNTSLSLEEQRSNTSLTLYVCSKNCVVLMKPEKCATLKFPIQSGKNTMLSLKPPTFKYKVFFYLR